MVVLSVKGTTYPAYHHSQVIVRCIRPRLRYRLEYPRAISVPTNLSSRHPARSMHETVAIPVVVGKMGLVKDLDVRVPYLTTIILQL